MAVAKSGSIVDSRSSSFTQVPGHLWLVPETFQWRWAGTWGATWSEQILLQCWI